MTASPIFTPFYSRQIVFQNIDWLHFEVAVVIIVGFVTITANMVKKGSDKRLKGTKKPKRKKGSNSLADVPSATKMSGRLVYSQKNEN